LPNDPTVTTVAPVCGDQDGSETPLVLNCTQFSQVIDRRYYQVPGSGPTTVHFDYVYKNAICDNQVSVFKVDDVNGSISGVLPGDPSWPSQVASRNPQVVFGSGSSPSTPDVNLTFQGGDILAFRAVLCGSFYYSYEQANADGFDHLLMFQNTAGQPWQLAWEDTSGGGDKDFDDMIFNVSGPGGSGPSIAEQGGPPNAAEHSVGCSISLPVNCATGEFWHQWNDLHVPGRGVPLDFTRTYSSGNASVDGPLGLGWTDNYIMSLAVDQSSGNVTILQEDGAAVTFMPNGSGGFVAAPRVLAVLVKNGDGSYTFTRNADQIHFTFSAAGQLQREVDRDGYATTLSYVGGQLDHVTDPAGRTMSFTYNGPRIASVTVGTAPDLQRTESFAYNPDGTLATATDPNNGVWRYTYDPSSHRLLTMSDPRNDGATTNHYNPAGQVDQQTDELGTRTTTWSYTGDPSSPAGGTTTVTDQKQNVSMFTFKNLELLSKTEGVGTSVEATTTYVYDPATLGLTSVTDPRGNCSGCNAAAYTTTYSYDANGNLTHIRDPLGRNTDIPTYNSFDEPLTVTDPSGVVTTRTYDPSNGNLLSVSRPLTGSSSVQTITYHYDDPAHPGDVTSLVDPNGHTTSFTHNSQGDLASGTDPLGNKTTYVYDVLGERTAMVSPRGNAPGADPNQFTTTYLYDLLERLKQTTDPLGHLFKQTFDPAGNLDTSTDGRNNVTHYAYDADNELTQITRADSTLLKYGYDGDGNQTSQTDGANQPTTYSYDALDRVSSTTDPLNRTTSYTYDLGGNPRTLVAPGGLTTSYGYDADNELSSISYSDGTTPNVSFNYTPNGLRQTMTDGTGTTTYSYDSLNRLTGQSNSGSGQTVGYGYDLNKNLTNITYPGNHTITRTYNNANQLTGITDWLTPANTTTLTPDPDGNTSSYAYPGGVTAARTFDHADQLSNITDTGPGNATLASFTYTHDGNGQLATTTPTGTGQGGNETYTYNTLNQLTSVVGNTSGSYTYDSADNPTQLITGAALGYDVANEVTASSGPTGVSAYTYDARGNRIIDQMQGIIASGSEITDAVRSTGIQGDGRAAPDSSFGIWQATTNLMPNGGAETNLLHWAAVGSATLTQDTSWAKFGTHSVKIVTAGGSSGQGLAAQTTSAGGGAGFLTEIATGSLWVKGSGSFTAVMRSYDANGGLLATGTAVNVNLSSTPQRVIATLNTTPSIELDHFELRFTTRTQQAVTFWADGAQIEVRGGATTNPPTPYVETNTSSANRAAGRLQAPSSLLNPSTGWIAIRFRSGFASDDLTDPCHVGVNCPPGAARPLTPVLFQWLDDGTHDLKLYMSGHSGTNQWLFERSSGSGGSVAVNTGTFAAGTKFTVIAAWTPTAIELSINGAHFTSANNASVPTLASTLFDLGSAGGGNDLNGDILWSASGSGTLTNANATTINNFGDTDPTLAGLPGTPTAVWPANTTAITTPSGGTSINSNFSYDMANRLTSATIAGSPNSSTYTYDGDGLRASTTSAGTTQHFAWDITGSVPLLLTDGSTNYIYDDTGTPVEQIDSSGTPLYYQHDQLGSTRVLTNSGGYPVSTYSYDAYGNLTSKTGGSASDTPLRWGGQYQDPSTGLYYLRARYYDPQTAQLLARDPLAWLTQEPYSYALDDPLNVDDPSGLAPECAAGGEYSLAGCGPGSLHVPDYGGVLRPACNFHDTCYGKFLTSRSYCDEQFGYLGSQACKTTFAPFDFHRYDCLAQIELYVLALRSDPIVSRIAEKRFFQGHMKACLATGSSRAGCAVLDRYLETH
jgi:RHS repeat-associated protein